MEFSNHTISTSLRNYVQSIFHFKNFMPDHTTERVVPTGNVYLLFELDGIERITYDNASLKPKNRYSKVWVSGQHKDYMTISAHPNSEMLVVQFLSYGAFPFFHLPMSQFNEQIVPAEEIFDKNILDLRDNINQVNTSKGMFNLVEKWLTERLDVSKTVPEELLKIVNIMQSNPEANFADIIKNCSMSQKHLISLFKKYIGYTPKYYHRILRFNEILRLIQQKKRIYWADIAYQCNYADQSHFIKDFKHFSGFNPSEFIKNDHNMGETNFFQIN